MKTVRLEPDHNMLAKYFPAQVARAVPVRKLTTTTETEYRMTYCDEHGDGVDSHHCETLAEAMKWYGTNMGEYPGLRVEKLTYVNDAIEDEHEVAACGSAIAEVTP